MSYHPSIVDSLAEELVAIRARQTDLKHREAEVRQALLALVEPAKGQVNLPTTTAVLRIERRIGTRFDAKRLPDHIRDDPQFQAQTDTTYVRVLPHTRAQGHTRQSDTNTSDAFDVIERF